MTHGLRHVTNLCRGCKIILMCWFNLRDVLKVLLERTTKDFPVGRPVKLSGIGSAEVFGLGDALVLSHME